MTNGEAIQRVLGGFQAYSDDSSLSRRYVFNILKSARSELLKQEYEKRRLLNSSATQAIKCFKLIEVDISECCENETGCTILRSELPLPKLVDTIFGRIITGVFDLLGNEIDKTTAKDWQLIRKRPYKLRQSAKYFIRNNYIYIVDLTDLEELNIVVEGIFEETDVVERLNNCELVNQCKLSALDYEFNCPGYLERRIFLLSAEEVARKLGIPKDNSNNAKEDFGGGSNTSRQSQPQQQTSNQDS